MTSLKVEELQLHKPPLDETASVLQKYLQKNFAEVHVAVVDCPDLRKKPFTLVAEGLSGNAKLLDVGGVPNLFPNLKKKVYDLNDVAELAKAKGSFLIGAGAGPFNVVGVNSEMMANVRTKNGSEPFNVGTYVSMVDKNDGSCLLKKLPKGCTEFSLMANLFACDGKPGKVIEVRVRRRTGELNFVDSMRFGLGEHYGTQPVGLGGSFAVLQGETHIHVMPDFSETPLRTVEDVNAWLKFYDMKPPLICVGVLISYDPGYDLRLEHFHGFGDDGKHGGHYEWDVTPNEMEYLGYFTVAETLYRIDRPT